MFLKKNWLPLTVFVVVIAGVCLYYLQTRPPKDPIIIHKAVEVEREVPPKPPPPGETAESGHWQGDVWHAEPHDAHMPVEVNPEVQGAPVGAQIAQPVNPQLPEPATPQFVEQAAQAGIPIQEFPARTKEYYDAFEKWKAWEDKQDELREEYSQLNQAFTDLLPATKEEAIRIDNDENSKRELGRKVTEAAQKIADVERKMREREANRPPIPYTQ